MGACISSTTTREDHPSITPYTLSTSTTTSTTQVGNGTHRLISPHTVSTSTTQVGNGTHRLEPMPASRLIAPHTGEPVEFSFGMLADVTHYFDNNNNIGAGGFGQVYKGIIEGTTYAIKKLNHRASDHLAVPDFEREIRALSAIDHENLVKLIGYCSDGYNRLLVCEYCCNLSLRNQLDGTQTLSWETRMKIAIGSAKGLEYLHTHCSPKIIHRDIKSDNIVLDNVFIPKIVDFGLAKIFPTSGTKSHISSDWKGTKAYADPDNISPKQKVSDKSDVYSFGVVLLELISGRKPEFEIETEAVTILVWAKPLILQVISGNEINISQLIDPKLVAILTQEEMEQHKSEMEMMLYCAAASIYQPPEHRPKMSKIVQALEMKIDKNDIWDRGTMLPET